MAKFYRISGAAKKVGLHPATLRRYEKMGLVQPQRDESQMRLYTEADIRRIRDVYNELNAERSNHGKGWASIRQSRDCLAAGGE